jgi:phosphopantothenoylcysteine synthetase/decarboxylase
MKHLNELAAEKNALTEKGQFVDAVEKFFAADAKTVDFSGAKVTGKEAILKGQKKTVESIAKVNGITLHSSGIGDDVSYAEFTFDFETKDGNHIMWHEVILSKWKNGHIVHEEYFKGL